MTNPGLAGIATTFGGSRATGRSTIAVVVLAVALFVFVPVVLSTYWIQIATGATIYAILALGLNLLYGRVGLVSLGQVALFAIGTWVGARLIHGTDLPFPIVMVLAGLVTAIIGVVIGLPALRLSGLYLGLVTLMAAGGIAVILGQLQFPNGGPGFTGISDTSAIPIAPPSIAETNPALFRYCFAVAILCFLLVAWQVAGKSGRAWAAIRESESAALSAGINITLYKLWAFALAAFITGVAGALLAVLVKIPQVTSFTPQESLILFAVVLMGGAYSLWGAVIAGFFMRIIPAVLTFYGVSDKLGLILFGLGINQVLLTSPNGVAGDLAKVFGRRKGKAPEPTLATEASP
jgi:branched-chain amino acid transport system permease protein